MQSNCIVGCAVRTLSLAEERLSPMKFKRLRKVLLSFARFSYQPNSIFNPKKITLIYYHLPSTSLRWERLILRSKTCSSSERGASQAALIFSNSCWFSRRRINYSRAISIKKLCEICISPANVSACSNKDAGNEIAVLTVVIALYLHLFIWV